MTVEPERVVPIYRPGPLLAWAFAVVLSLLPLAAMAESACREDRVQIRGDWGEAAFSVDVVDTMETRARGLMFVEHMPRGKGKEKRERGIDLHHQSPPGSRARLLQQKRNKEGEGQEEKNKKGKKE